MILSSRNYLLFFFTVLPIALVFSPAVSEIIIIIISLSFIFQSISDKSIKKCFNNLFSYFFFLWCLYLIVLSLFSIDILLSLESSLFYFRFGIFALAASYFYNKDSRFIDSMLLGIIFSITILTLDGLLQFFTNYNILGYEYKSSRISSFFGEELKMGYYSIYFGTICLSLLFLTNNKFFYKNKIYFLFFIILFINILVVLAGERKALALLIIFDVSTFLYLKDFKKIIFITSVFLLTSIFGILYFKPEIKERYLDQTINQFQTKDNNIYLFSEMYQSHYITATNIFLDNKLFGVGPKIFRVICADSRYYYDKYSCTTHPHHAFLQILSETGIMGFIPLFLFFMFFLIKYLQIFKRSLFSKNQKQNNENIVMFFISLSIIFIFLPILPSGNLFNNWNSMIHFIPIGFMLYVNKLTN